MTIRSIIVDDEPLAINVIKNHISKLENIEVHAACNNAIDALNFLKDHVVDVIYLDINMPLLDGLSFIESLHEKPQVIITSAYEEYAIKTYELDVLDYLVKPISFPRFMKSYNKIYWIKVIIISV